jgi:hypothetical protein
MSSWITSAFVYGLGVSVGRAIFGEDGRRERASRREPVRQQTEEEILADEKRYAEEERKLDADDAAARAARKPSHRQGAHG